jgi:hypothetical protein
MANVALFACSKEKEQRTMYKGDSPFFMKQGNSLKISSFLEKTLLDLFEINKPINSKSKKIKRIADEVRTLSDEYVFSNSKNRINEKIISRLIKTYAVYFLPSNLVKLHPILDELRRDKEGAHFKKIISFPS